MPHPAKEDRTLCWLLVSLTNRWWRLLCGRGGRAFAAPAATPLGLPARTVFALQRFALLHQLLQAVGAVDGHVGDDAELIEQKETRRGG
jgi:hypothetical protein